MYLANTSDDFDNELIGTRKRKTRKAVVKKPADKFDNLSLTSVAPLTEAQRQMFYAYAQGYNIVADGSAGTGKTFSATYLALKSLFDKEIEKIIFVRNAVSIRSQGHLPGTLDEKEAVYTIPFKAIVDELCGCGTAWEVLTKKDVVKFMTTTYIRGITLKNCVVIVDEFQNCDSSELESVLTRLGENSRVIVCGDTRQNDLSRKRETSSHDWMISVAGKMPTYFDTVNFTSNDIVRSEFVKALIMTLESM